MDSMEQIINFLQSQRSDFVLYGVNVNFPITDMKGQLKERYKYPVNTKQCKHENTQELDQILQTKQCEVCGIAINSYKDLVMDIRWIANQIMHPDIEFISIIQGHIFHQFTRPKQYYEFFKEQKYLQLVEDLFRNYNKKNDFMQFAKEDPLYMNAKPTDKLNYDAICQLDFVKIQIPVRHKDCKHVGCYELTSLLAYKNEVLFQDQDKKFIECSRKCQVKIDLNRLEQELVLDKQLLNAIRKGQPHSIKFYISQNYELIDEHKFNNFEDQYLKEFYKQKISIVKQNLYQKFELDVFNILKDIYSRKLKDLDKGDGKKVLAQSKLYEFQHQTLDLEDPFLKPKVVEFPVRCVCCPFNKCSDIRTYIGSFLIARLKTPMNQFQCPLCQKTFKQTYEKILNHNIKDYIYLDQNLFKRLLENRKYVLLGKLEYKGRDYMLEEFQKRHKIFTADVKKHSIDQNREYMEFENLNCVVSGQRLKIPLQLYKCPEKQYVDFDVFYEQLIKVEYDFSVGLTLCKCQICNNSPITSINEVFFDEFFQAALTKLVDYEKISKTTEKKIQIRISDEEIIGSIGGKLELQNQQSTIRPQDVQPRKPGFESISSDEDYQTCVNFFKKNDQYNAQFQQVTQNIGGIIVVIDPKNGITHNIDEKQQSMNQAAEQDPRFQKYGIKVSGLKVEVKNDEFKLNSKINIQAKK